jgi:hypothetical protein
MDISVFEGERNLTADNNSKYRANIFENSSGKRVVRNVQILAKELHTVN